MQLYFPSVGFICVVFALWLTARRLRVQLLGKRAIGTVLRSEKRLMGDTDGEVVVSYVPTVAFVDDLGRSHQFTSNSSFARATPKNGTLVEVRYLPSDPRLAFIWSFRHMWLGPLVLAALGLAGIATLLHR